MEQGQSLQRKYIRRMELFALTGIKVRSWDDWHQRRIGPPRIRVGRAILYDLADIVRFLENRKHGNWVIPTSERTEVT
jgi:hypothetical protein